MSSRLLPIVPLALALTAALAAPAYAQEARPGGLILQVMAGPGYGDYEDRSTDSGASSFFAQAAGTLSLGYASSLGDAASLVIAGEVLVSRSLQSSAESRAASNLFGGGLTAGLLIERALTQVGVGLLLVRRAPEAQDLGLTENGLNPGIEGFLTKHWALSERLLVGVTGKFVFLPTREVTDASGTKMIRFSEGIGFLALGLALR
jgi:hypothetical protein